MAMKKFVSMSLGIAAMIAVSAQGAHAGGYSAYCIHTDEAWFPIGGEVTATNAQILQLNRVVSDHGSWAKMMEECKDYLRGQFGVSFPSKALLVIISPLTGKLVPASPSTASIPN